MKQKFELECLPETLRFAANALTFAAAALNQDREGVKVAMSILAHALNRDERLLDEVNELMDQFSTQLGKVGVRTVEERELFPGRASKLN